MPSISSHAARPYCGNERAQSVHLRIRYCATVLPFMSDNEDPELLVWQEALSWLEKAREDTRAARLLPASSLTSLAAFHVQQATEKSLKALLAAAAQDIRRIHDV